MTAPRLLIVDDNAMNVLLTREVLVADGFEIDAAADAFEACARIATFRPDLILMDVQMPVVNGLALTREIKANPASRHIVIVAYTAFAMQGDEAKMRAAGCDGYLSKPVDANKFATQVLACLAAAAPTRVFDRPASPG